jgi:uncharacterized iron-regulated membrane protein
VISPALVRVHRLVALGLGALVVLVTLAGAALVFRDELTPLVTPQAVVPPRAMAPDAYQRMLEAARALEPSARSIEIVPAPRADRAAEVIVHGARGHRHLFFDPHDARLVADSERQWMPFATLFWWHKELLAGGGGSYAIGVAGFAAAFLAGSGIALWWPRAWKYALRLRLRGNRVAVSFDLHRSAGALFALFLLLNAITGASMVFDEASPRIVNALAGASPLAAMPPSAPGPMKPLPELIAAAERSFPAGTVSRILVRDDSVVVVRKRLPSDHDTHGMNRIYVDGASAAVLKVSPLERLPPGNAMYEWLYPLHTGKLVGLPWRIALLLAGLVPLLSLITGLILWRSKAQRRNPAQRAAIRSPSTAA